MKNILLKLSFLLVVMLISFQACKGGDKPTDHGKKDDPQKKAPVAEKKNDAPKASMKPAKMVKVDGYEFDVNKHFPDVNPDPKEFKAPDGVDLAKGDAAKGKEIFLQVKIKKGKPAAGNCAACHCVTGMEGCGNIGPAFTKDYVAKWKEQGDAWLYAQIADARITNSESVMPPTISTKILKPEDIVDLIAYLKSIK